MMTQLQLALVLFAVAKFGIAVVYHKSFVRSGRSRDYSMISTTQSPVNRAPKVSIEHLDIPNYRKAQMLPRYEIGKLLTPLNRLHADMGYKLRSEYLKSRQLTREEEKSAGTFSQLGKRLEKVKLTLSQKLDREPSVEEWAAACQINVPTLKLYCDMAQRARERLVQHNMRLVDFWVRRLIEHSRATKDISYYELVTEGVIGLTVAAENYDGRGAFIRFAQLYIRGQLYRGITKLKPGSFANFRAVMINYRAARTRSDLAGSLGRQPTDEEVARAMGVRSDTVQWARVSSSAKAVSAQTVLGADSDSGDSVVTYLDLFLRADQAASSDGLMWQVDFNAALNILTPQERRTISIRYGLMDGKTRTVERTAELMCVSPEAIRQIIGAALNKLRGADLFMDTLSTGPPKAPITTMNGKMGAIAY